MIRSALHYARRAPQLARAVAASPVEAWLLLRTKLADRRERRRPPAPYEVDPGWERRLHDLLGVPWPCRDRAEFWALWPEVLGSLRAEGLRVGVGSYAGWNDGEPGLVRAAWCLTRHLRPLHVVETGVARGVTSRFVLEALERNGAGHLWSIDLPPPMQPELRKQIGAAVTPGCRRRWSYVEGSSRRRLPGLLARLGRIGLFIHDSWHSEYNMRFELDQAWAALGPGGAVIADDIDLNWAFRSFIRAVPGHPSLICRAEPLQPDRGRFDDKGLFGIVRKSH